MKAILVDDELYNLEELSDLVSRVEFITYFKSYSSSKLALEESHVMKPDIAFIDIEMPFLNGMSLSEELLKINPKIQIIFVTAYNQYAVQAFELNALDYLLKPINPDRFFKTISRIKPVEKDSTMGIKIRCFNKLEVYLNGSLIKWDRNKALECFGFLLMNHGKLINKDIIVEQLWSEYEPQKALAILQTSVWKIRNVFQKNKDIRIDYIDNCYSLHIDNCECDYLLLLDAINKFDKNNIMTYHPFIEASLQYNGFFK